MGDGARLSSLSHVTRESGAAADANTKRSGAAWREARRQFRRHGAHPTGPRMSAPRHARNAARSGTRKEGSRSLRRSAQYPPAQWRLWRTALFPPVVRVQTVDGGEVGPYVVDAGHVRSASIGKGRAHRRLAVHLGRPERGRQLRDVASRAAIKTRGARESPPAVPRNALALVVDELVVSTAAI